MRKKLTFSVIVCIMLIAAIHSCRKALHEPETTPGEIDDIELIGNAQWWYERNKPSGVTVKSSDSKPFGKKKIIYTPNWGKSSFSKDNRYQFVETEIDVTRDILLLSMETSRVFESMKDPAYIQNQTRLVYRYDHETGKDVAFLMTIVPDLEYIEDTGFRPFGKISYLDRDSKYSGLIMYYDLEGNHVKGLKYRNGKIVASISPVSKGNEESVTKAKTKSSSNCQTEIWYEKVLDCDVNVINIPEGYDVYFNCIVAWQVTSVMTVCEGGGGGGGFPDDFGGGGGGGGGGDGGGDDSGDSNGDDYQGDKLTEEQQMKIEEWKKELCFNLINATRDVKISLEVEGHTSWTYDPNSRTVYVDFTDRGLFTLSQLFQEELFHDYQSQHGTPSSIDKEFEARVFRDIEIVKKNQGKDNKYTSWFQSFFKTVSDNSVPEYVGYLKKIITYNDWTGLQNNYERLIEEFAQVSSYGYLPRHKYSAQFSSLKTLGCILTL